MPNPRKRKSNYLGPLNVSYLPEPILSLCLDRKKTGLIATTNFSKYRVTFRGLNKKLRVRKLKCEKEN